MAAPSKPSHQNRRQKEQRSDPRLKKCPFCGSSKQGQELTRDTKYIDYKDYPVMKPFIDYFGNIRARYYTGVCLGHQKMLRAAVERARFMAFLAYRK